MPEFKPHICVKFDSQTTSAVTLRIV